MKNTDQSKTIDRIAMAVLIQILAVSVYMAHSAYSAWRAPDRSIHCAVLQNKMAIMGDRKGSHWKELLDKPDREYWDTYCQLASW